MSNSSCNPIRQRFLELQGPPVRYELTSPYTKPNPPTKYELDMRRKVEILQYGKNVSLTSRQKYTQIVSSIRTPRGARDASGNVFISDCPSDLYKPTLSSSCDVPGPIIELIYNPDIPLYNYAPSSSVNNAVIYEPKPWSYFAANDIFGLDGSANTFATVALISPTDTEIHFDISVPIGISISGTGITPRTVQLASLELTVRYNGAKVTIVNPLDNYNGLKTVLTVNPTQASGFYGRQYLGNLTMKNLTLTSYAGYVYDIQLTANFTIVPPVSIDFQVGAVYNISSQALTSGCTISPSPPTDRTDFAITETNAI